MLQWCWLGSTCCSYSAMPGVPCGTHACHTPCALRFVPACHQSWAMLCPHTICWLTQVVLLLLWYVQVLGNVNPALAARSAGRAGGFSAPSSRSYSGGGSSGSRSYSGGGYSGGGYSGGGYTRGYSGYRWEPLLVVLPLHRLFVPCLAAKVPLQGWYSRLAPVRTCSHCIAVLCCAAASRAPIIVPSPPIYAPMYPSTGIMVAPGAAVVSTGPGIVDIAIVSMFLVMAASAATSALKGSDADGDGYDAGKTVCLYCCSAHCAQVSLPALFLTCLLSQPK